jgi:hypothetical protein
LALTARVVGFGGVAVAILSASVLLAFLGAARRAHAFARGDRRRTVRGPDQEHIGKIVLLLGLLRG